MWDRAGTLNATTASQRRVHLRRSIGSILNRMHRYLFYHCKLWTGFYTTDVRLHRTTDKARGSKLRLRRYAPIGRAWGGVNLDVTLPFDHWFGFLTPAG